MESRLSPVSLSLAAAETGRLDDLVQMAVERHGLPEENHTPWLVHYPTFRTFAHPADWPHSQIELDGDDWTVEVAQRRVESGRWMASLCTTFSYREGELWAEPRAAVTPTIRNILFRDREHRSKEALEDLLRYIIATPPISKQEAMAAYQSKVPLASRSVLEDGNVALHQKGTFLSRLLERDYLSVDPLFADYSALATDSKSEQVQRV
ncbi:MAG TPA: hypothetical protein VMU97_01725 [Candidatus Dormibacteraeota bacterium]|nr:hypothetical protein [Candidatus Dormibacteraeota bacterium]